MKLKPIRRSLGLILLTDGIRAILSPSAQPRKIQVGTPLIDDILEHVAENRDWTLRFALGEVAFGLWLVLG